MLTNPTAIKQGDIFSQKGAPYVGKWRIIEVGERVKLKNSRTDEIRMVTKEELLRDFEK